MISLSFFYPASPLKFSPLIYVFSTCLLFLRHRFMHFRHATICILTILCAEKVNRYINNEILRMKLAANPRFVPWWNDRHKMKDCLMWNRFKFLALQTADRFLWCGLINMHERVRQQTYTLVANYNISSPNSLTLASTIPERKLPVRQHADINELKGAYGHDVVIINFANVTLPRYIGIRIVNLDNRREFIRCIFVSIHLHAHNIYWSNMAKTITWYVSGPQPHMANCCWSAGQLQLGEITGAHPHCVCWIFAQSHCCTWIACIKGLYFQQCNVMSLQKPVSIIDTYQRITSQKKSNFNWEQSSSVLPFKAR